MIMLYEWLLAFGLSRKPLTNPDSALPQRR